MVATRNNNKRPPPEARTENAARRVRMKKCLEKAQQEEAFRELLSIMGANGGRIPYGAVDKLVKTYHKNGYKAVTRDNLNYRLKKNKKGLPSDSIIGGSVNVSHRSNDVTSDLSNPSDGIIVDGIIVTTNVEPNNEAENTNVRNVGGRKKGSKKKSEKEEKEKIKRLITTCATLFNEEKQKAKKAGTLVSNGVLKKIIDEESKKSGLSNISIPLDTIRSRVKRGNLDAFNANLISPIHDVEPTICQFCIRLAKMGSPLTKTTIIELANDLLADTEYMDKIRGCKELRKLDRPDKLSDAWYRGFMSRYSEELTRNGTSIKDSKRNTWVTKENFQNMYENVYQEMVKAGIAEEKEEEIQYETGLPSRFQLTKPEYLLFVDETGCNTNQLNDGRVGGELFVMPKVDSEAGAPIGSTTDLHFTVLGFISGTGEAVMCAVIFKSDLPVSEIPVSWKLGLDITCNADDHSKVMARGPMCTYLGKQVPCFFATSPKASITTILLRDMLAYLDSLGLYDRSIASPFLLLDGHHSRMMLPFLKCVMDPSHRWHCCFGVPYATHIWQVGDASAINGSFKINLTKAKREYIKKRGAPRFEPTDIVPLLNKAFPLSFGNQKGAIKAIAHRGWNPLNYNLLTVLPDQKDAIDLTKEPLKPSCALNLSKGTSSHYIDLLIQEQVKNEGRKKKFDEIKKEQATAQGKIENLKKLTKVSSAQLAARKHYVLDEIIRDLVFEWNAAQEAVQMAIQQQKKAQEEKKTESLKQALRKFTLCPNGLTVPEMKALVTAASTSSDSPVKKKKQELQGQLNREPRLGRIQQLAREYELTMTREVQQNATTTVAEALIALGVQGPVIPM